MIQENLFFVLLLNFFCKFEIISTFKNNHYLWWEQQMLFLNSIHKAFVTIKGINLQNI